MILNAVIKGGSGGGLDINGIVQAYAVYAGETISAGDFVEFVHSGFGLNSSIAGTLTTTATARSHIAACALSDNRVFFAYNKGYSRIITINGNTISVSTETQVHTQLIGDVVKLTENKVLITTGTVSTSSTTRAYFMVATVNDDDSITAGTVVTGTNGCGSGVSSLVALSETSAACISLAYSLNEYPQYIIGINISGDTVTLTSQSEAEYNVVYRNGDDQAPSICKVNDYKFAVVYGRGNRDTNSEIILATYSLNGGIVVFDRLTTLRSSSTMGYVDGGSCGYIKDNYIFTLHTVTNGSGGANSCVISVYNCTDTAHSRKATKTVSVSDTYYNFIGNWIKCVSLPNYSCIFVSYDTGYAYKCTWDGASTITVNSVNLGCKADSSGFANFANGAFIAAGRNLMNIYFNTTKLVNYLLYPQEITTEVKTVANKISGVAMTDGITGDVIEVMTHEVEVI